MDSGDNQFLSCKVEEVLGARETQLLSLEGLRTFSELSYLPIKMEKTFVSGHYMDYGKVSYFKGKRISQAIKRSSRIGTESQETIPSLNTKVSGIYTTAIATAAECATPASAYALAAVKTGLTLLTRGFKADTHRLGSMLLLGRQLGSLKTSSYASFCVRGLNDTATVGLSVLRSLEENRSIFHSSGPPLNAHPYDWVRRIGNKYSRTLFPFLFEGLDMLTHTLENWLEILCLKKQRIPRSKLSLGLMLLNIKQS